MHASITLNRVMAAVRRSMRDSESYIGFCHACGRKAKQNCEPDAENYPCGFKSCGQHAVYGAEETLMMMDIDNGIVPSVGSATRPV